MISYKDAELSVLLSLVRERDDGAFSELVARYTPMLSKLATGFVAPGISYDEAFSEACFALHRAAMSYDSSRSSDVTFGLYSKICVYRRLCDLVSTEKETGNLVDLDVDSLSADSGIESRLVLRERMSEYLNKARSILSEYEYRVFLLYIEGYTTAEIAGKLGRDAKSVDNAKARMLKHLREANSIFSDI
jgi:RNA polymerase sporulation-specific sigma factor